MLVFFDEVKCVMLAYFVCSVVYFFLMLFWVLFYV